MVLAPPMGALVAAHMAAMAQVPDCTTETACKKGIFCPVAYALLQCCDSCRTERPAGIDGHVKDYADVQVACMAGTMGQQWEGGMGNPRTRVRALHRSDW